MFRRGMSIEHLYFLTVQWSKRQFKLNFTQLINIKSATGQSGTGRFEEVTYSVKITVKLKAGYGIKKKKKKQTSGGFNAF